MSLFRSNHGFCPAGYQTVKVGLVEVHMGRDPNDPGKLIYPHYNSVATLEALGFEIHRKWRSMAVFERELRKSAKREFTQQLKALEVPNELA